MLFSFHVHLFPPSYRLWDLPDSGDTDTKVYKVQQSTGQSGRHLRRWQGECFRKHLDLEHDLGWKVGSPIPAFSREVNSWRRLDLLLPNCLLPDHPFGWSRFIRRWNPTVLPQCLEPSIDKWRAVWWRFPESGGIPIERSGRRDRGR